MSGDTWFGRELPVLVFIVEQVDQNGQVRPWRIPDAIGMEPTDVEAAVRALTHGGYLITNPALQRAGAEKTAPIVGVTEKARRDVGAWPSPEAVASRYRDVINRMLAGATDDDRRAKLERIKETVDGIWARDLFVSVTAEVMESKTTPDTGPDATPAPSPS